MGAMMERADPLGEEKVSNLLVKYSVPATVGMLVNSLYNVVDRIFIGNGVGYNSLARSLWFPYYDHPDGHSFYLV